MAEVRGTKMALIRQDVKKRKAERIVRTPPPSPKTARRIAINPFSLSMRRR